MKGWKAAAALILCIAACLAAGGLGAVATSRSVASWYPVLNKPSWTPPNWLFGPVWTLLYIAMGVAVWRVARTADRQRVGGAIALFAAQLLLNAGWSFLFFGARRPGWAALEILALWAAIAATLRAFARIDPWAAGLLVPYLAWVSYAAALNLAIWRLNP